jgi:hypothetical protein
MNKRPVSGSGQDGLNVALWVKRIGSPTKASALAKLLRVEAAVVSCLRSPLSVVSATLRDKLEAGAHEAAGTA